MTTRCSSLHVVVLSLSLLSLSGAHSSSLDLGLPKDILTGDRQQPEPDSEALVAAGYRAGENSPVLNMHRDNVKSIIFRRSQGIYPKNNVGKIICGEASFKLTIRPDGSIDRLDVVPTLQQAGVSSNLETYYVQPTPAFQDSGSSRFKQVVSTDEEESRIFSQTISESIRAAAPFPPHPRLEHILADEGNSLARVPLVLASGSIGVACVKWEPGKP